MDVWICGWVELLMIGASKGTNTRSYQVLSTTNITSTGSQDYTIPEGVVFVEIEM